MRKTAAAFTILCLHAQSLTPDLELLTKIRTRMIYNLQHQPNYTCVETIERFSRAKQTQKLRIVDTLRLEVALVEGREMFAWPGSKEFDETDITKFVTKGTIGNGSFGTHAQALFMTRAATFHYAGEAELRGKKAIRFDYVVPQMLSGYKVRVAEEGAIVGYHGSFYADPATFDMERIEVIADNIPRDLLLASTEDKIDYAVARIGDGDFLLPAHSELSMVGILGREEQNHVTFRSCREYSGESVISFADPVTAHSAAESTAARQFDLPAGLDLELVTTKDLNIDNGAIGDPVYARVPHDVKQHGQIVVPKGATATGRVTRIERYDNFSVLGVEFSEIEAPGIVGRMKGKMVDITGPLKPRYPMRVHVPPAPGEGLIQLLTSQRRLFKGCIMFWRT
jgi:hypothetical protein